MKQSTIHTNERMQFLLQTFGDKKITAITEGNTAFLIADVQSFSKQEKIEQSIALNRLHGMFKNTTLLSSEDFADNKRTEKELEDEMHPLKKSVIFL
jgi:CHASE1-domain containing sensor protein